MDKLEATEIEVNESSINQFILSQIPDFFQNEWDDDRRQAVYQQAQSYLMDKKYSASTFEMYQLQGTPSSILIDKKGLLRKVSFGAVNKLEDDVQKLLNE